MAKIIQRNPSRNQKANSPVKIRSINILLTIFVYHNNILKTIFCWITMQFKSKTEAYSYAIVLLQKIK
ncbi:protein of unknown function [Legionella hackeliae]|uniref:Uncharacterized protein n=1 Tax=Legionella hackeliae TaxID=449 RepID=A0A0A8UQH4_LEGHA|nr:protein of unknown function [Legionella hackeliae]